MTLPKMCDYKLSGWRSCQHRAHFVRKSVCSKADGGSITRFQYLCADHATADSNPWPDHKAPFTITEVREVPICDGKGGKEYGFKLAKNRARAAFEYIYATYGPEHYYDCLLTVIKAWQRL